MLDGLALKKSLIQQHLNLPKSDVECNASVLEISCAESVAYTGLQSDRLSAGAWLEMVELLGFNFFFEGLLALDGF